MKKFIDFCILFAIYVTENYITEDWSIYKLIGKIYYYPFWFIRSCIIWLICPIFLPEYFFKTSQVYKEFKKVKNSPEFNNRMSKINMRFK
jgi:hypothetical protein